tara:strand:- start:1044 stop:1739 length:696 start_codon:yes stop_codon:yes gene_type:complete
MSIVQVDAINESTTNAGVTIDNVLIKDGKVDGADVSKLAVVLLGSYDLTSSDTDVATIEMDQVFSSDYENYQIKFSNATADTGTCRLQMRMRTGASGSETDFSSSIYDYNAMFHRTVESDNSGDPTASGHEGFNDDYWKPFLNLYPNSSGPGASGNIELWNGYSGNSGDTTNNATFMRFESQQTYTELQMRMGIGVLKDTSSYGPFTGFKLALSSGNFNTISIRVYGWKNS